MSSFPVTMIAPSPVGRSFGSDLVAAIATRRRIATYAAWTADTRLRKLALRSSSNQRTVQWQRWSTASRPSGLRPSLREP
jgi:hypothetical protein